MGQDPQPAEHQPRLSRRVYANDLRVVFTLSECCLDFAQNFGPDDVHIQTRLVTSPTVLAEFHSVIDGALADYEAQYGEIPGRAATGGDDG